jgi:hypothetical protein
MPDSDAARQVRLGIKTVHFMVKKVRLGTKKKLAAPFAR